MNAVRAQARPLKPLPDDAPHILVVDDDRRLRDLLGRFLREHGYRVSVAADAADAWAKLSGIAFDGLVLDVMMPGQNGFDFARELRKTSHIPILMLTARADAQDRITGLEIGVDDYLAKPFETRELTLRLANILKRAEIATASEDRGAPGFVRFGAYIYFLERGELRKDEETVRLTERERDMLTTLARATGQEVPREALSGGDPAANERTVDVQVNRLRRKIERDPGNPIFLQTVRGIGYRLVVDR